MTKRKYPLAVGIHQGARSVREATRDVHHTEPPCNCQQCEALTVQSDYRRREILASLMEIEPTLNASPLRCAAGGVS